MKDYQPQELTIETKEKVLLKPCIRVKDVMLLTGLSERVSYYLMADCKNNFNGRAGIRTDAITPKSLCLALGTTIEDEMRLIGIAKGYIKI